MKLKSIDEKLPSNRAGRFAAVAVLVSGMALLPNCISNTPPRHSEPVPQPAVISAYEPGTGYSGQQFRPDEFGVCDLDSRQILRQRIINAFREAGLKAPVLDRPPENLKIVTSRVVVTTGDVIRGDIRINTPFPIHVSCIDATGICLSAYGRIEYRVPRIIGEFETQTLVNAEPGPLGTAILNLTYADFSSIPLDTGQKASAMTDSGTNAAPFQTSGPVWK